MPGQPTAQDLHIDTLLSMLSVAYMNAPDAYIADEIFPIVPVRKQSDIITKYSKDDWFRDEAQLRTPGTESQGSGFNVDLTTKYFALNYAVHKDIPDEVRENADEPFNPDMEAVQFITDRLKLRREKAWSSKFFTTSIWGTDKTGGSDFTVWSNYADSDPIGDIENGKTGIHSVTGREANTLIVGRQTWAKLKHHPDFIERIKYTQRAILTEELVAALLEIPRLMVGRAINNTAAEGQTGVYAYVFGKNALLAHVASAPSLMTPSAGYTFHWNRFGGITYVRRLRDDFKQFDRFEAHTFFDQSLIGSDLGYFFSGAVA